jgi:hypothetical protein
MTYRRKTGEDEADMGPSKKVTGRELTLDEQISIRLDTLVELLHDKGIINEKELESRVAMHMHEISKATAFEKMDEEI